MQSTAAPLVITPANSVQEALDRMALIDASLAAADGIACFNRLYRKTTEGVQAAIAGGQFADLAFTIRLDVLFANRYFAALDSLLAGTGAVPEAWQSLFTARSRTDVAPLQFALAGMNAHINFDLGQAVVATCKERGLSLARDTAQYRDYLVINDVLAQTETQVKAWFTTGDVALLDAATSPVDDTAALWSIRRARDAAWSSAEAMWALGDGEVAAAYVTALDGMVALAGRALLAPPAATLERS